MTTKFSVPEISCDHCKSTIIKTLSTVDDIELVEVNIEAKDVTLKDSDGNVSYFKSFFSNLEVNEFYGKDIKMNFSNKSFGNSLNEPRLYGNILEFKDDNTILIG